MKEKAPKIVPAMFYSRDAYSKSRFLANNSNSRPAILQSYDETAAMSGSYTINKLAIKRSSSQYSSKVGSQPREKLLRGMNSLSSRQIQFNEKVQRAVVPVLSDSKFSTLLNSRQSGVECGEYQISHRSKKILPAPDLDLKIEFTSRKGISARKARQVQMQNLKKPKPPAVMLNLDLQMNNLFSTETAALQNLKQVMVKSKSSRKIKIDQSLSTKQINQIMSFAQGRQSQSLLNLLKPKVAV